MEVTMCRPGEDLGDLCMGEGETAGNIQHRFTHKCRFKVEKSALSNSSLTTLYKYEEELEKVLRDLRQRISEIESLSE
jgi:hypothetical protein